jgi:hypothetical protein
MHEECLEHQLQDRHAHSARPYVYTCVGCFLPILLLFFLLHSFNSSFLSFEFICLFLLAYFLVLKKINGGLWNHLAVCLYIRLCLTICLCIRPNIFGVIRLIRSPCSLSVCVSLLIFVTRFIKSPCCLSVCVSSLITSLALRSVSHQRKVVISSPQNFLFYLSLSLLVFLTQAAEIIRGYWLAAEASTVLTEVFSDLPQFLQENNRLVPQIRPVTLSSTSFPILYSLTILQGYIFAASLWKP